MDESFWNKLEHRNDKTKYVGYDFRGSIFKNTLSSLFFQDENRKNIILKMDKIFSFFVDHIKHIKKGYNWTFEKKHRDFN